MIPDELRAPALPVVRVSHAPDLGICDDCGSEQGRRRRTMRLVVVEGETARTDAWLCSGCRGLAAGS